jgi:hypothetical protein
MATVLVLLGAWDNMVVFMRATAQLVPVDVQLGEALPVQEEVAVVGVRGVVAEAVAVAEEGVVAIKSLISGLFISLTLSLLRLSVCKISPRYADGLFQINLAIVLRCLERSEGHNQAFLIAIPLYCGVGFAGCMVLQILPNPNLTLTSVKFGEVQVRTEVQDRTTAALVHYS